MEEIEDIELDFITGKYGLMVPRPRSIEVEAVRPNYAVLSFFRKLWTRNGFPFPGGEDARRPDFAFEHELGMPATNSQPLLVLRASSQPRDKQDIEHDRIRAQQQRPDFQQPILLGKERYSVLTPASGLGAFVTILEVEQLEGLPYGPGLQYHDQDISENNFETPYSQFPDDWRAAVAVRKTAHQAQVTRILAETTRLLA